MKIMSLMILMACGVNETEPKKSETVLASPAQQQAEDIFQHYEALRVLLVNDKNEGYRVPLEGLISTCADAVAIPRCVEITGAATVLAANDLSDLELARKEFGDLSKAMVGLVVDMPMFKDKMKLFSCPMAQKYPNWIQANDQLENPYMGQRMLKCGKAMDWSDL